MDSLEQATELYLRVCAALDAMGRFDGWRKEQVTEDEVGFRFDAIVGMLIIAQADLAKMLEEWAK